MKQVRYQWLLILIGLSSLGIFGAQFYLVRQQYQSYAWQFRTDIQKAIGQVNQDLSMQSANLAILGDSTCCDSIVYAPDSTMMGIYITKAVDFHENDPNAPMPMQMQKVRDSLASVWLAEAVKTYQAPDDTLYKEVLTIAYSRMRYQADSIYSIAEVFPFDSLLASQLTAQGIELAYSYGLFMPEKVRWAYWSPASDTSQLHASTFNFPLLGGNEILYLYFPDQPRFILGKLSVGIGLSVALILVVLGCFWWLARIIFQQKQLSELKNDFISNMTHEFKTPIATIAFAAANIENEKRIHDPEQIRQFTRIIKEENTRMNHQVEQVLRAAVAGRNAFKLKQEPINLHELLNQISDAMEVNIQAAGGVLHRRLNAARAALTGDAFHLANVFSNLLDNARKYTQGPPEVTISTEDESTGVWVKVIDKGVGMTAEATRRVFDQFYRIPTGNVHTVKGFGLGLSYAKAIVEQHGGDISVESKPGQGSIFAVFLPFDHKIDDPS